jgi:IS5 family transposase
VAASNPSDHVRKYRITASDSRESQTSICKKIDARAPISGKSNRWNSRNYYCQSTASGYFTDDYTSKQKRRVTPAIKREMRRRSAVEPVIGHLKDEHRMGRNYLAHRKGDLNNAILAAAGYNFRRLIKWLRILLCLILTAIFPKPKLATA